MSGGEGASHVSASPGEDYRYSAFISYRHVEPDRKWAKWLHSALETYRVPSKLVARGIAPRIGNVFRDEEELPASADLKSEIESALRCSRFLIVVCSRRTPESRWVNQEVVLFRHLERDERILALLIDGEPSEAFPQSLREIRHKVAAPQGRTVEEIEEVEPLAADVRTLPARKERPSYLRRMARLRILACLLGCRFDDLRQREQERRARRLAYLSVSMLAIVMLLSILSVVALSQKREANRQRNVAEQQRLEAHARLVRLYLQNGWHEFDQGLWLESLPWFAEALAADFADRDGESRDHLLLAIILRHFPQLRDVHFQPNSICDAAFSPDGTQVAIAGVDGVARRWSVETGESVGEPLVHGKTMSGVSFTADSRSLLTWGDGVRVWNISTNKPVTQVLAKGYPVMVANLTPDAHHLLAVGSFNPEKMLGAVVYDVAKGIPIELEQKSYRFKYMKFSRDGSKLIAVLNCIDRQYKSVARVWDWGTRKPVTPEIEFGSGVVGASLSGDGSRLIVISEEGRARVGDIATGKPVGREIAADAKIRGAILSSDGRRVLTVHERLLSVHTGRPTEPSYAQIWDVESGNELTSHLENAEDVLDICWSPNEKLVATIGSTDARLWSSSSGRMIWGPIRHHSGLNRLVFSPDGKQILTAGLDGTARLWRLPQGGILWRVAPEGVKDNAVGGRIAEFSPDGRQLLVVSFWKAHVLNAETGRSLFVVSSQETGISHARFTADGQWLVTAGSHNRPRVEIRVWDAKTGKPVTPPLVQNAIHGSVTVQSLDLDRHGRRAVTAQNDGTVCLWDLTTPERPPTLLRHNQPANHAEFDSGGTRIAVACGDGGSGAAYVWNTITSAKLLELKHEQPVRLVAFSPDGKHLATASAMDWGPRGNQIGSKGSVRIWDMDTGAQVVSPLCHDGQVRVLRYSNDGTKIVTASRDRTARVWDACSGRPLIQPLVHSAEVTDVRFDPTGRMIATASGDPPPSWTEGESRVWDARTGIPITPVLKHTDAACSVAFSPDGKKLVVTNESGAGGVTAFDLADDRQSADALISTARLISEDRVDETGGITPIGTAEFREAWTSLHGR
jgi:WD40 repeat protein